MPPPYSAADGASTVLADVVRAGADIYPETACREDRITGSMPVATGPGSFSRHRRRHGQMIEGGRRFAELRIAGRR